MENKENLVSPDDILFKEIVLKACPALGQQDITSYQKVCMLRNWTAQIIDVADYDLLFDIRLPEWYTLTAYQIYQLFKNNTGGVWCAGAAVFLKRVLEQFGFEAYYLDYGHPMAFTHAVTLVKIIQDEKETIAIQDAFFNTTYESPDGRAQDYFAMLSLLKEKYDDRIIVVDSKQQLWRKLHRQREVAGNSVVTINKIPFTLESFFADRPWIIPATYDFLKNNSLPPNYIYLHLFPSSIWGGPVEILEKARKIAGWPRPLDG